MSREMAACWGLESLGRDPHGMSPFASNERAPSGELFLAGVMGTAPLMMPDVPTEVKTAP